MGIVLVFDLALASALTLGAGDELGRLVEGFPDRRQREWLLCMLGRWRSDLAASAS